MSTFPCALQFLSPSLFLTSVLEEIITFVERAAQEQLQITGTGKGAVFMTSSSLEGYAR